MTLDIALQSHLIDAEVVSGDYDKMYDYFLSERAGKILTAIVKHVTAPQQEIMKKFATT